MSLKRKVLIVSDHVWPMLFGEGSKAYQVLNEGLPEDAVLVAARHFNREVAMVFGSDVFDGVREGETLPELKLAFRFFVHRDGEPSPPGGLR